MSNGRGYIEDGEVIGGRYRVSGVLGQGGFGTVYDAVHVTTGHAVAVKVLSEPTDASQDEMQRRFFQEAATTSRLSHPNTVRVFDFGETDGGFLFLAMERLVGETLQEVISTNVRADKPMDGPEAANIGIAVLRSLSEAHAHGLVHRDLKPANIFLHEIAGGDRIVKVLDFGIVKDVDASMTQAGKALGTPTHMSPEQAMGTPVDARSDLYALGVCLYECVTGRLPFIADNPLAIVMQHVTEPVTPIAERMGPNAVPPLIAAVIERALAKLPDERFDNAQHMRESLQHATQQQPSGVYEVLNLARGSSDRRSSAKTSPSSLTPRSVPIEVPPSKAPVRRDSGVRIEPRRRSATSNVPELDDAASGPQKSSIRVNIPGVNQVAVRTGEQRIVRYAFDESTAIGTAAMRDEDHGVPAIPRVPYDVDGATQVLDSEQLQELTASSIFEIDPQSNEAMKTRMDVGFSQSMDAADPPPPIAAPAPPVYETPTVPKPPPLYEPPPRPDPPTAVHDPIDSAVMTIGAAVGADDLQHVGGQDSPADAAPPPQRPSPMPSVPRKTDDRLGGFAQRGGSFAEASQLLAAAGLVRGSGGSFTPMGAGSLQARLSADLRRMTEQLQHRTSAGAPAARKITISSMALGDDMASAIYGNGGGEVRLVHFGPIGDEPVTLLDGREEVDIGSQNGLISAIATSPDGRVVVTAAAEGSVRAWSPSTGECVGELELTADVSSLAVATDGRLCVIGCDDGTAHLAKLPDLRVSRVLSAHTGPVTAVDIASSRRILVTAGEDGSVRTWDPVGGGGRVTKRYHEGAVGAVAISRDRRWIASGGWDGKIVIWAARTGDIHLELDEHVDVVSGLVFDSESEHLASVSDDRSARVWRVSDGQARSERSDFKAAPKFVRFSRDGRSVFVGAWDGSIRRMPTGV